VKVQFENSLDVDSIETEGNWTMENIKKRIFRSLHRRIYKFEIDHKVESVKLPKGRIVPVTMMKS
jgi:hypothetical protein